MGFFLFYIFQGTATKDTYYKQSYSLVLESGVKLCLQGKFCDEFRDLFLQQRLNLEISCSNNLLFLI